MATPTRHALLSASSAERWLHCTAAPRFEENFPEGTSEYADEGSLAHSICELYAQKKFSVMTTRKFNSELKKLQAHELYQSEMLTTAEFYVNYLTEKAMTYENAPFVAQEVRVDFSEYVRDGFGTCDCIMIGGDTLHITDYKHGKGVPVSSINNPQMRLYALGALHQYSPIFGDSIKYVSMAICQPRLSDDVIEDCITVDELIEWGNTVKPLAEIAYSGLGSFVPGDHCRFCRGRYKCKARAEQYTALEDFKDCVPEGKITSEEADTPNTLTNAEVADLLIRGASIEAWLKDLKEYATETLLSGGEIPGWKVVAGRSNRAFANDETAMQTILTAGYDKDSLYVPKSLAQLEKVIGKKAFAELLADQIIQPYGKPTLVKHDDPREVYSSAMADFKEVLNVH